MSATQHILVIDDDGDVRDVLLEILQDREYRVSLAVGGRSMREFLRGDDPVDVVVLDAAMPGEASASLALYAKGLGLPVVMISGSPKMMQFAIEHDLQLLEKPFRGEELIAAIVEALASGEAGQRRTNSS
jgi:two-component system OmpR family response regulator